MCNHNTICQIKAIHDNGAIQVKSIRISLLILILTCLNHHALFSQFKKHQSQILQEFYKAEQENWIEYIHQVENRILDTSYDVLFYSLDVDIRISSPYIKGKVTCLFQAAESNLQNIRLDLHHALTIDSITGDVQGYLFSENEIEIKLDRTFALGETGSVTIYYQGIPPVIGDIKGLRYETHGSSEPVIASLSTPFLAHTWWPCKDGPGDKADSVYVNITIPDTTINNSELIAVSNGILENVIESDGRKIFQWRHRYPIIPYYVMVAVSNYQEFGQNYQGNFDESFPIDYYVFSEHLSDAQDGTQYLPEVMRFFSSLFGPYPFEDEKYGMTQLGFYGGIENQTNTIINRMSFDWFGVFVHELSHMWFGDMITCADWHHGWLNEGFATYCVALWVEFIFGTEAYKDEMDYNIYLDGGTLYLQEIDDPMQIFIRIIYRKGAYVLHMLRHVLGDSHFFESLYQYSQHPDLRYGHAKTEDLQEICEAVSGMDLDFFFQQWIYDEYYPIYAYHFSQDIGTGRTTAFIAQVQSGNGWRPFFEMPVDLQFHFVDDSDTLITVWNDQENQTFEFYFNRPVLSMTLDPDGWILKEIQESEINNSLLLQNYPNPFNQWTMIPFQIYEETGANVSIAIFDVNGRAVKSLCVGKNFKKGNHQVAWDGSDDRKRNLASGLYFIRFKAGDYIETKKIILLR